MSKNSIDGKNDMKYIQSPVVNIVTTRISHHAGHSGYDRLVDYIDAQRVFVPARFSFPQRLAGRLLRPIINRSGSTWYHRDSLINEMSAGTAWMKGKNQVFHYLYGENSFRYLGKLTALKPGNSIVCTYHTPPEKFHRVVRNTSYFSSIDAVIAVSTMQMDFLSDIVGVERTHYVPHGIDVGYFTPGDERLDNEDALQCLFVGSHLRDIETLAATARLLAKSGKKVIITAVTSQQNKALLDRDGHIVTLTKVNDEDLLRLYQKSDVLLLPLLEATANNSILEAMACGLPIISTDLQGVRDYVTDDMAILVRQGDAKILADTVVALSENRARCQHMAIASREQALKFRWEVVSDQIRGIYKQIA